MVDKIKKIVKNNPGIFEKPYRVYCNLFKKRNKKELVPLKKYISTKKCIYFDVTSYSVNTQKTGIWRVVNNFIKYLPKSIGNDYELVFISGLHGGYKIVDADTFLPKNEWAISPKEGDVYISIDHNPVQPVEYWGQLKEWKANGCKFIACVYDLVYVFHPEYVATDDAVFLMTRWLNHVGKNFDLLISISRSVQNELLCWLGQNNIHNKSLKTDYFYLGCDIENSKGNDSLSNLIEMIRGKDKKLFVAVSTIEPRKGYKDLLAAFDKVFAENDEIMFVIVGRRGWKNEDIEDRIINSKYYNKRLFWLSNCDDVLLNTIYNISDYYISGSYYEGFGLGVIEAASKGLPVILRDIPIYREITDGKAKYFTDIDAAAKIINDCSKHDFVPVEINDKMLISWEKSVEVAWEKIKLFLEHN